MVSNKKSKFNRIYTEGKYLESFVITKELFVEWGTARSPKRLVRPTFPELYDQERILMARQKRITAYTDQNHVCDVTIVMGILAHKLKNINNPNISKYYKNLKTPRHEIEENSKNFDLKYILGILNSNMVKYFLKHNSVGKIDSAPDDWKKIPIRTIPKSQQKQIASISETLIKLNAKLHTGVENFSNLIKVEFELEKLPTKIRKFYNMDSVTFMTLLEKISPKKISLKKKKEWGNHFNTTKQKIIGLPNRIEMETRNLNQLVYDLYGMDSDEITLIEDDLLN